MMANINVRTDAKLKEDALKVFRALGMDMSTAINVFLSQVVQRQAIPFELSLLAQPKDKKSTLLSLFGSIDDPTFSIPDAVSFESPREKL